MKGVSMYAIRLFVFLLIAISVFTSCFEEEEVIGDIAQLTTSVDTLRYDTVFTEVGSITRSFTIRNESSENFIIENIRLADENSPFRINVDGTPGPAQQVRIFAGDSIHVFVEVTIDPDQPLSISPFIITESLLIIADGGQKAVTLEAWGQNANYFPSRDAKGNILGLTCNNGNLVWDDPKPYVIYGLLIIDSCTLDVAPGTDIYFHGGLARQEGNIFNDGGLIFGPNANVVMRGTPENPITIQSDRLESNFQQTSGQYAGIRFLSGSRGNELSHVNLRHSLVGIRADSSAQVSIENTQMSYIANVGVIGQTADINMRNCLIHNTGNASIALLEGGNYNLTHCTFGNFGTRSAALIADNFRCINQECSEVLVLPLNIQAINTIFTGSTEQEIVLNDITNGEEPDFFTISLQHTLIKPDELFDNIDSALICDPCIIENEEPLFVNINEDDYRLDSLSQAINRGMLVPDLLLDIDQNMRDEMPDLGCYEYINE